MSTPYQSSGSMLSANDAAGNPPGLKASSTTQTAESIGWNQPALQVVGLEDSMDRDDTAEYSGQPAPRGFQDNATTPSNAVADEAQMAYVQRCLLQLKDRMNQQLRDSENRAAGRSSTPTPSEDLAYAVQTSMITKDQRNAIRSRQEQKQQAAQAQAAKQDAERQAQYMLEQARRDEHQRELEENDRANSRRDDDESDGGNPFEAARAKGNGGERITFEDQTNLPDQLDWLGSQLDKHYGSEESNAFNTSGTLQDKLDYVYRMLKQREQKKYQAIKTVIPSVNSPGDDDVAYGLAFKGAIGGLADKIKQSEKAAAKRQQKQVKSKL